MRRYLIILGFLVAITIFIWACRTPVTPSSPGTTNTPPPASSTTTKTTTTNAPAPTRVTIDLTAQNIAFNLKNITVSAGASVTVNFNNMDAGVPHNFSVYQNLAGGQTKAIFVGQTITGPATTVYKFTAPADKTATYFFECDVHPTQMNGGFIVQ
jgi:plastocyanin